MQLIKKVYKCEIHGDVEYIANLDFDSAADGYISSEPPNENDRNQPYCQQCQDDQAEAEEHAALIKAEQEQKERQRKARHYKLGLPKRFENCNFDTFKPSTKAAGQNLNVCKNYADNFESVLAEGKGLLMVGKVGTGKTHLACAIGYRLAENGYQPHYACLSEVIRRIRATWSGKVTKTIYDDYYGEEVVVSEQDVINDFVNYDLLIIDEIGVQSGTESERNLIFTIIDERYQAVRPTIVISNLTEKELAPLISERSIDRIKQFSGTLTFDWASYRTAA
jgi:DNA replication protein DnaC